ncbi:DnaD and phage-associated region [Caldisalinibacter kiritimatiensis]|uniref:DnaD and phage-associated region n=1 Tax=Caldisalinibacter kiritimatiensis TaxID=1304284 RepID=R1CHT0_9FIRM|nr:DnaD domain protein [Caldisalinibacter kiritimatiensis]EOD01845.1 DnaD and phage-associated region [Caldisalinibacter kiritimatiensis]
MSFVKETTEIDLGDTSIENIFINDFMPMANGTYVKVYLLGYKYANDKDDNIEVNNETISKHLNIPLSDVLEAWDFWEEKGIIKKHKKNSENDYDYTVEFLNLKQLYIKNNFKPINNKDENNPVNNIEQNNTYTCSVEDLVEANKVPSIQKMFKSISDIIRRPLVPNEKKKILEWMYNYNMTSDVIVRAYAYSVEKKNKKNASYVEGIIRNWYDMNITNLKALDEYFKKQDEKFYRYERVMKALGFYRPASEAEMKAIDVWFNKWKFTMDIVLKACENTKKTSNPNINYINGILKSWFEKGIKTVDEIEEKDKSRSKPKYTRNEKSTKVRTKFHNFDQRTSKYTAEELEKIVRKRNSNS